MALSMISSPNRAIMHATFPNSRHCNKKSFTCGASQLSIGKETNFYKVLALESEHVSADEIKRAYRSMALRYHPDVCPPSKREEYTQVFIDLKRAYEMLSDPVLREKYDYYLGLMESGFEGMQRVQERTNFPREVWVNQLNELKVRSNKRAAKKRIVPVMTYK